VPRRQNRAVIIKRFFSAHVVACTVRRKSLGTLSEGRTWVAGVEDRIPDATVHGRFAAGSSAGAPRNPSSTRTERQQFEQAALGQ